MRRRVWVHLSSGLLWAIVLSACGTQPGSSVERQRHAAAVDPVVIESLQRQLRAQERRIAELESQLNALKTIDQDWEKRRRSIRPPATLTPIE